jgi:hypothetical protein
MFCMAGSWVLGSTYPTVLGQPPGQRRRVQVAQCPAVAVAARHQLVVQLACVFQHDIRLGGGPRREAEEDGDVVDGDEVVLVERLGAREQHVVVVEVDVAGLDHVGAYRGQVLVLPREALLLECHNLHEARQGHLPDDVRALDALGDELQPLLDRLHGRQALGPEAEGIGQVARLVHTDDVLHGQLQRIHAHHCRRFAAVAIAVAAVEGGPHQDAQAQQDIFAAAVEADHGRLQLRAVQLHRLALGAHEERGRVQLVQVERLTQLERVLLKFIVDLILAVADRNRACRRQ